MPRLGLTGSDSFRRSSLLTESESKYPAVTAMLMCSWVEIVLGSHNERCNFPRTDFGLIEPEHVPSVGNCDTSSVRH